MRTLSSSDKTIRHQRVSALKFAKTYIKFRQWIRNLSSRAKTSLSLVYFKVGINACFCLEGDRLYYCTYCRIRFLTSDFYK